ncbi:MAG: SIMPL domain-containing protein [Verrucomicrobiae bacterium]|nr:SIMPL domain-containing protein [Verrucomicrobiae bacterium]
MKSVLTAAILSTATLAATNSLRGQDALGEDHPRTKESPRLVSLFSQGEGSVEADSATVFLRHTAEATKLAEAISLGAAAKQAILSKLTEAGLPKNAITFENFTSDSQHGKLTGRVKSYTVSSPVTVKVTDESEFAAVALVVDADPNLEYLRREAKVSDAAAAQLEAAESAVENLRRKAALYEKSFGVKLELFSFSEISQKAMNEGIPRPVAYGLDSGSIDSLLTAGARSTMAAPGYFGAEHFGKVSASVYLQGWYRVVPE